MKREKRQLTIVLTLVMVAILPLAACATPATPTPNPSTQQPAAPATAAAPTAVPPTATPQGPKVGGTVTQILDAEPDTLDAHATSATTAWTTLMYLGLNLVIIGPNNDIVPGVAESWTVSPDGLTWEFKLKKGVKFHDGNPLTAADYAWTLQRAKGTKFVAKSITDPIKAVEAPDDYTLRILMNEPNYPFLYNLTQPWMQPLSKASVERWGEQYGRHPVGIGPYMLKEWKTGDRIVLERNPDFDWGPSFAHKGPYYIETIVLRIILEAPTRNAALESGEATFGNVEAKDVARLKALNQFNFVEWSTMGDPLVYMNNALPFFQDLRVRQAFTMAVDKKALATVVGQGAAVPQPGPVPPSVVGYWPGVEKIAYPFDLTRAKALMQEVGYTPGADGILQKDGKPLRMTIKCQPLEQHIKTAEVLREQFKALGVALEIQQVDQATLLAEMRAEKYELAIMNSSGPEIDILWLLFSSKRSTLSRVKDPELDRLLDATRTTVDPAKHQEVANQAQQYIVEKAYIIPTFTSTRYTAVSKKLEGVKFNSTGNIFLNDAYFIE